MVLVHKSSVEYADIHGFSKYVMWRIYSINIRGTLAHLIILRITIELI